MNTAVKKFQCKQFGEKKVTIFVASYIKNLKSAMPLSPFSILVTYLSFPFWFAHCTLIIYAASFCSINLCTMLASILYSCWLTNWMHLVLTYFVLNFVMVSLCPTFGGSNPGLRAELIHMVKEQLSLILGCAFMTHPSAFASISVSLCFHRVSYPCQSRE